MSRIDAAARARHDLGKYIALQSRWLPDDAPVEARRGALIADLRRTRSGMTGDADAVTVWAECRPELLADGGERDPALLAYVDQVDRLMAEIAAVLPRLERLDPAGVERTAAAARRVGDELRELLRVLCARELGD